MPKTARPLTDQQRRWVEEYLVDCNGVAAALRAGHTAKSASTIAQQNLMNPAIQELVRARQASLATGPVFTREELTRSYLELMEMGRQQNAPGVMQTALRDLAQIHGYKLGKVAPELNSEQKEASRKLHKMSDAELLAVIAPASGRGSSNAEL